MENTDSTAEITEETNRSEVVSRDSRPSILERESILTNTIEQTEERKDDEVSDIFREKENLNHLVEDMPENEIETVAEEETAESSPDAVENDVALEKEVRDETEKEVEVKDEEEKEVGVKDEEEREVEVKDEEEREVEVKDEAEKEVEVKDEAERGVESKETGDGEQKDDPDGEPKDTDKRRDTTHSQKKDDSEVKGVTISDLPDKKISEKAIDDEEGKKTEKTDLESRPITHKMSTVSKQSYHSRVTISEPVADTDSRRVRYKRSFRKSRSIVYDISPRFRFDDDDRMARPSGDFGFRSDAEDGSSMKFYTYMDDDEAEEEEEEIIVEEEEIERIDRTPYYVREIIIKKEIEMKKIRNYILQKKLAMFFKRRKMDRVLHETDQQFDTQQKYGKKLDLFGELIELDNSQRNSITADLEDLKKKRENKFNELNKLFENMQERENEIGLGLIDTKTGKTIPDKLVERLIRRQHVQMNEVSAMRLKFIKLREMVVEKEKAISDLDQIGDGLYLMDYEQLKVENRSHADKIEEKEEDLTRLRFKCQNTIQILAHIREKSSAIDSDLDDIKEDMSMVQMQNFQVRQQLNGVKQGRDHYRSMTNNLRNESGLLTQPELLRDMESSMEEYKTIYVELKNLQQENKKKSQQIRNIRKNMEFSTTDMGIHKTCKNVLSKPLAKPLLYKGRPSLCKPTISEHAFDYLKNFRPKVELPNKKK